MIALLLEGTVPWMLSAMHQPPVHGMHLLWLLLLDVGLQLAQRLMAKAAEVIITKDVDLALQLE
ncbi:hypothetical protein ACOZB2_00760, partial [Pantoea endophytica]